MEEENSKYMRWKETWMVLFSTLKELTYQPHSIPIVPDEFRKSNGNAYIPKVISIGPRHRGRSELLPAEGLKWRCIKSFLRRVGWNEELFKKCMEAVLKLDAAVRTSYATEINLDRYELATVMLFDGCFLLELLYSISDSNDNKHSPTEEMKNMEYVFSDLMLVENQIPLVILDTLFHNISDPQNSRDILLTSMRLHGKVLHFFGLINHERDNSGLYHAYHILDIAYVYITRIGLDEKEETGFTMPIPFLTFTMPVTDIDNSEQRPYPEAQHLNRCATRLEAVGIAVKCLSSKNIDAPPPVSSTFQFIKDNVKFNKSNRILEIPQLDFTQTTQVLILWKNFIAWENHNRNLYSRNPDFKDCRISITERRNVFTSSALLFADLICCTSDVQLLKNRGVIVDQSTKNNQELMDFFHSIVEGVDRGIIDPMYGNMFHELNTYSSPKNYATKHPILLFHYFCRIFDWGYNLRNFFWRGYNFAATMVTILSIVQTCYAIVGAYHDSKKTNCCQRGNFGWQK